MRRRDFLTATGVAGALATGCRSRARDDASEEQVTGITRLDRLEGDLAIAALANSLENLAIALYQAARDLVADGKLRDVPPAVVRYIETAQEQHTEHAKAWNGIITGTGKPGVTGVNLALKTQLEPMVARSRDYVGISTVFLELESITAASYLAAIGAVTNNAALKVAASIHPVELEHVAFLNVLLGRQPTPDAFAKTDGARPITDTIG